MKKSILMGLAVLLALGVTAQQKVALHHNGTTTIFGGANPLTDAYNAAVDGDTLYLPGATLTLGSSINKKLSIWGAGHYPDSTAATGKTIISSSINIQGGADSLFLEGLEINGYISFLNNEKADHVIISRCRAIAVDVAGNMTDPCIDLTIRQCVITGNVTLSNATSSLVTNNILQGAIVNGNNNAIYNNVMLFTGAWYSYVFNNNDNCSIANNIVFHSSVLSGTEMSTFSNNVFVTTPGAGSNTFIDNYFNVSMTGFFVDQSGSTFSYDHDYHLSDPGTYLGFEGSEVGIYGGLLPWKEGAVPSNPHILSKSIPTMTDENGMLNVSVTVSAQQE